MKKYGKTIKEYVENMKRYAENMWKICVTAKDPDLSSSINRLFPPI